MRRKSARRPPRSARSVRLSPTKARASNTPAIAIAAKKARRSNGYENRKLQTRPPRQAEPHAPQEGRERTPAPLRASFAQEHLGAAHRRRERQDDRVRLLARRR